MPTIEVSHQDLCKFIGKKISIPQLELDLPYAKCELKEKEGDLLKIEVADTNRPDLWGPEGIARELKGHYGLQTGLAKFKVNSSKYVLQMDKAVLAYRPYVACAVVKNCRVTDQGIKDMIQWQEKLTETFGHRRSEVSIGIYDHDKITWPIRFVMMDPDKTAFVPLDFREAMFLRQILSRHPKGQQYGHLLEGLKKYPLFIDAADEILSMPPVINSNHTGKVTHETKNLFIEATGKTWKTVHTALAILAANFHDQGCCVESVVIQNPKKRCVTPDFAPQKITVALDYVNQLSGLGLTKEQTVKLLRKARYDAKAQGKNLLVQYPAYRQDLLHPADVVEDVLVQYGFNNIKPEPPQLITTGKLQPVEELSKHVADILTGLGGQEILSYTLTNKEFLYQKMNLDEQPNIEIHNAVSKNWSIFRTWILPSVMEFLNRNKMREYPQQVFEIGEVVLPDAKAETRSVNPTRICWAQISKDADYTHAKQALDYLFGQLGLEYNVEETEHTSFVKGRVGRVIVKGKKVAYIGEVHPQVLENWGLEMPVCAIELNLTELLEIL